MIGAVVILLAVALAVVANVALTRRSRQHAHHAHREPSRDRWPFQCMATPRPDQTLPADDARRDVAAVAWAIAFFLLIVFLSSAIPDTGAVPR